MAAVAPTVAVIGLGAVGGSVAKALLRASVNVRAYAESAVDRRAAQGAGIGVVDEVAECVAPARTVLIAVPVLAQPSVAAAVVAGAAADAVLLHAASLQSVEAIGAASGRAGAYQDTVARRVIGTHPLAGSHRTGFDAADADLFAGCVVSIEERAPATVRAAAEDLWRVAGARRFEYRSAEEHDVLMAWASHLPQLASTALADAIASAGVAASALGPGGRDATRLAASSFDMWAGILAGARPAAARAAAALENSVARLRAALESGDMQALAKVWAAASAWRNSDDDAAAGAPGPGPR